jgi:hypothetical protein
MGHLVYFRALHDCHLSSIENCELVGRICLLISIELAPLIIWASQLIASKFPSAGLVPVTAFKM